MLWVGTLCGCTEYVGMKWVGKVSMWVKCRRVKWEGELCGCSGRVLVKWVGKYVGEYG